MNQGCVIHHSVINTINHHAILKRLKLLNVLRQMSIVLESLNKKRYILNERIREIKIRKKIPILEKTPRTILKKIHSNKKIKSGTKYY